MKKLSILFVGYSVLILAFGIVRNQSFTDKFIQEEKYLLQPNDEFWVRRTFPSSRPDERAYFTALQSARQSTELRGNIPGFDKNWKVEGPGNIGARVNVVAVHPTNENIILIGYSHGGIWKTINGGQDWYPVFDDQIALAIGEIVFDENNPSIVYAGTGDVNIPGGVYTGNGVYKSTDGGETWNYLALADTRIVSKIKIDPNNSSVLYVATMGNPFERNTQRGLYKSTDGGVTWQQSLFVNNQTGIIDLVMNPQNPQELYAASYTRIRTNFESIVTSADCIVWKSTDGGNQWNPVEGGLPLGSEHSRIGLAICQNDPSVVYALYVGTDLDLENVYKTEDSGTTWNVVPTFDTGIEPGIFGYFGWYFGKIGIDPADCNTIHLLGVDMFSTFDGGSSWVPTTPPWWTYEVHADKHDLVYTPGGNVLLGTDGGLYRTPDFNTWNKIENIPTSQFYRVAYNPHQSDLYYGGMQDNGTASGNASFLNDWTRLFGGDGFQPRFNPVDPLNYYYETQNAGIVGTEDDGASFYDLLTDSNGFDPNERRNWDAPYIISNHNPDVLYFGAQKMYKSYDRGHNWIAISGDLTGDVSFLGRVHTMTSIDESALDSNIIYAGTGNGYLWKTNDNGITWDSIHYNGLPVRYLTSVHASPTYTNTVFATFSGYKFNELISHIYRSDDQGETWSDISGDLPGVGINDVLIIEGEKDKELYIGTDAGVYGTINGGLNWERVGKNMPIIPVLDVEYNPALKTLIAGTFARSILSYPIEGISKSNSNQYEPEELSLFPNPVMKNLYFNFKDKTIQQYEILIYNLKGNIVMKNLSSGSEGSLKVEGLAAGCYIITFQHKQKKIVRKFVKG